jgi:prevent-host-death family protein
MADDAGAFPRKREIGVTEFKAKSLGLIDDVQKGRLDEVVLTKRGRPVARLSAIIAEAAKQPPSTLDDLFASMRGTVTIMPGVDLTEPTSKLIDWNPFEDEP